MKLFSFLSGLLLLLSSLAFAQNSPLGSWRVHLPYLRGTKVAEAENKIYCVADKGLFYYNKQDYQVGRLSKINGLSDNDISLVRYNTEHHVLVIAYNNANIDLLFDNHDIINIADIQRFSITGNTKSINEILFKDRYAYLSCGFGIVVLDLVKKEIKETYYLGTTGTNPGIYDLTLDDQLHVYAASDSGVYLASLNDPNLNNFANWTKIYSGSGIFNHITFYGGKLLVNEYYSPGTGDSIWSYQSGAWSLFNSGYWHINDFNVSYGTLVISYTNEVKLYDQNFQLLKSVDNIVYNNIPHTNDALIDKDQLIWIADEEKGLVRYDGNNPPVFIAPNGPKSALVSGFAASGEHLWVAHGPVVGGGILYPQGIKASLSSYKNGNWKSISKENTSQTICSLDTMYDLTCIVADPADANHVFTGAYGRGVIEFKNEDIINVFDKGNTGGALQYINNTNLIRVGGMALDNENRLWVCTGEVGSLLAVKNTDNTWQSFYFTGVLSTNDYLGAILVDDYNQKWCINVNKNVQGGILVFNDNNTIADKSDDQYRLMLDKAGQGGLPEKDVRAIAKDRDGSIWVGTAKGIAVFYSPSAVFSGGNFDAQQVLIQYGGYNQYLLETEIVTAIAIDGANRKWFGTENGGVFLMSADGTKQLENFNVNNSPLLSNNILRIAINKATGEVFFGTDKGIISYRGTATEGEDGCADTYVYPNPITESYEGPIAVKGLAANSNVKITDISGTVIYETKAEGGQAIWNGRSLNGQKAHTGVYLVYCSDEKGANTCVTKMVFIN